MLTSYIFWASLRPATLFKKETLTYLFSCEFCEIFKSIFLLEYLRTAASETGTENSLGNLTRGEKCSARNEKLHIISFFFFFFPTHLTKLTFSAQTQNIHIISLLVVWLGSKYAPAQRLSILKYRMKSVEDKAMLESMPMLNNRVTKSRKRNQQIFMSITTKVWPCYFLGSSITLNRKPY